MIRAFALLVALAGSAAAGPAELAEDAARRLTAAAAAMESSGDRIRALTEAIGAYDDGMAALREGLRQTDAALAEIDGELAKRDAAFTRNASLLIRLQSRPRETLALHPKGPLAAMRAGRIAATAVETLGEETARLAGSRDEARDLLTLRREFLNRLATAQTDARAARAALITEADARSPEVAPTDIAILTALLDASDSLGALADAFVTEGSNAPDLTGLRLPAQGDLSRDGDGAIIATDPGALVTTPIRATIRYAGPAPGAPGETAILAEPAPGHLLILSGQAEALVRPGQIVAEGEPLAIMRQPVATEGGADDPNVNESQPGTGQPPPERLYIAWREGNRPADISGRFDLP